MAKTVWILGAGFSQPLGGPMLRELLGPSAGDNLRAVFSKNDFPQLWEPISDLVVRLFNYGTRFARGWPFSRHPDGEELWPDAEAFLDYLDDPPGGGKRLGDVMRRAISGLGETMVKTVATTAPTALAGSARRLVAAQCSAFPLCQRE